MIFVHGIRPNIKSMIKSYCALIVLGIVAIIANNLFPGANYLFMAKPEDTPSVLDILPKNYAVRIMIMAVAMATLFFLAYLPWFIKTQIPISNTIEEKQTQSKNTSIKKKNLESNQAQAKDKQVKKKNNAINNKTIKNN